MDEVNPYASLDALGEGPFDVLLSSAGRRVALLRLFRQSLRELGLEGRILASDASSLSAAFHDSDAGFVVPRCYDPDFIPTLLDICARERIRLLVPTIDPELPILAAHKAEFLALGTTVAVSTLDVVDVGNDKQRTHEFLVSSGFPTVHQARLQDVFSDPSGWRAPLIVKPAQGSAGVGVQVVKDVAHLPFLEGSERLIVQSLAPGLEYTVDVLVDRKGSVVCAVPRRRVEVRSGEVSKGVTERQPAIVGLATDICETLPGPYGAITVQIFFDHESQELSVIEINPRFGGGFPLTRHAGGDYPRWMIEDLLGVSVGSRHEDWRDGVVMLRYDDAIFLEPSDGGGLL